MNTKNIVIFDTTLRDGEQSPGVSMGIEDKVEIARQLELLLLILKQLQKYQML